MRPHCGMLVVTVTLLVGSSVVPAQELTLVKEGASEYVILLSQEASKSEEWAAKDLVEHIRQMSGATLKIESDGRGTPDRAVIVGDGRAARALGMTIDVTKLGEDGFVIRTVGSRLVIAGGRARGTMYGVYEVLSKLGCRWWAPGESMIPQMKTIALPAMDMQKVPALEYRDVLYGDLWLGKRDKDHPEGTREWHEGRQWCARNHVHARYHDMPDYLGPLDTDQAPAHGVLRFLPLEEFEKTHPEYYALVRGRRVLKNTQPCWSNKEAAKVAAANVIKMLDANPKWHFITLGQEDFGVVCECDGCKAFVEKHGAKSALVVTFVNRVAEIVKAKYPDVWLNATAYRWSQKAPTGLRCADRVMITIPPIACNYAQPLSEAWPQENADYKKDLEDWMKICNKIYVCDYSTNFVHYTMPFPNMHVVQPNVKFFIEHNVRGLFEEGSHTTNNGQFSKLVMWLCAQAMWNPDADGQKLIEEFCQGYYGPKAGPLILEYIGLLHDKVVKDRIPIWATHRTKLSAPHLTPQMIARGEQLFRQAEAAVAGDPVLLRRVQVAHFPVQYMLLSRSYACWQPAKKLCPELSLIQTAEQFARIGREGGIKCLAENDEAEQLYQWAIDYARIKDKDPKGDLPAELKDMDPAKYTLVHAAQFDQKVKFLKKAEGAADGWAMQLTTFGWLVTNELGAGKEFTPGKRYKLFMRVRGTIKEGATGPAVEAGVYTAGKPRACSTSVDAKLMDGRWQTVEVGTWSPDESGGLFFAVLSQKNIQNFKVKKPTAADGTEGQEEFLPVFIDGLWLVETADAGE